MHKSLLCLVFLSQGLPAQVPPDLARERSDFAHWLATAPNSPLAARAFAPVGSGIRIGPEDGEVPFTGVNARISERAGIVSLSGSAGDRVLPRNRLITVAPLTLFVSGRPGQSVVRVFGGARAEKVPTYFPYDATRVFTGPLLASEPRTVRILTIDGFETEATEVGTVSIPDGTASTRLRVYRITDPGSEESELMIYFRDGTSDKGAYPAGRFVTLEPAGRGGYRLDLNRARNPFCAYSSAYPCPAPWPGNTLASRIEAGEQYHQPVPSSPDTRP